MKILIVTDAWHPQINGVVRTLEEIAREVRQLNHEVVFLTPNLFKTIPCPTYPEIRLSWNVWKIGKMISNINPDAIHIATEGPLGITTRIYCSRKKIPFSTSYHTKMPEYVKQRIPGFPLCVGYAFMRWLHKPSASVLVTTESVKQELKQWGFKNNLIVWSRGVNHSLFNPSRRTVQAGSIKTLTYIGRISPEKNLEAFLSINLPYTRKVVVGDGPIRQQLQVKYPDVEFVGYKMGDDLAEYAANADVFVFPSKSDTFGIVMVEAAACGSPIAAYPVTGPIDFVVPEIGCLDEDLEEAIKCALFVDRIKCANYVYDTYSWYTCAKTFINALVLVTSPVK